MHGVILAALMVAAVAQTPATDAPATVPQGVIGISAQDPNASPVIDLGLRMVRAGVGGSSIARSAVRGDEQAFLYAGLGPCLVGAAAEDPGHAQPHVARERSRAICRARDCGGRCRVAALSSTGRPGRWPGLVCRQH